MAAPLGAAIGLGRGRRPVPAAPPLYSKVPASRMTGVGQPTGEYVHWLGCGAIDRGVVAHGRVRCGTWAGLRCRRAGAHNSNWQAASRGASRGEGIGTWNSAFGRPSLRLYLCTPEPWAVREVAEGVPLLREYSLIAQTNRPMSQKARYWSCS